MNVQISSYLVECWKALATVISDLSIGSVNLFGALNENLWI